MKTCSQCGETKPLDAYHRMSKSSDGRRAQCKVCRKGNQQEKEKARQRRMVYYESNRELEIDRMRSYRQENREELLEKQRNYWRKTKDQRNEQQRESYRCNPHPYKIRSQNRRAAEAGAEGFSTKDDQWKQYIKQRACCAYCGTHIPLKGPESEWDHLVPLSQGGSNWPSNMVWACRQCNRSKWFRTIEEWPNAPWEMKKGGH